MAIDITKSSSLGRTIFTALEEFAPQLTAKHTDNVDEVGDVAPEISPTAGNGAETKSASLGGRLAGDFEGRAASCGAWIS